MIQLMILQKLKEKVSELAKKHNVQNQNQIQISFRDGELSYYVRPGEPNEEKYPLKF